MSDENLQLDMASVLQAVTEFSAVDQQIKAMESRKRELRDRLYGLVEMEGEEDAKGNKVFPLPEVCGDISRLQLQRRCSRVLDGETAEEILRDLGVWEECVDFVPVLNEDKIMEKLYDRTLTEEQVDQIFPEVETFAFTPVRLKKSRG